MKATKIIYWVSSSIVALMMSFSAYMYFTNPEVKEGFHLMGFPDYFRVELGIAKLLGAIVLLVPLARSFKEWAYAGFAITFISAFIAHTVSGHPVNTIVMPLIFFALLIVSYITYRKKTIQLQAQI